MKWFFVTPNQAAEIHKIPFACSDSLIKERYMSAKDGRIVAEIIQNDGDEPGAVNFGLPSKLYWDYVFVIVDDRQAEATGDYLVKEVLCNAVE